MGSGTTAVAALKEGRHFLGFEINADYCKTAKERIKAVNNGLQRHCSIEDRQDEL